MGSDQVARTDAVRRARELAEVLDERIEAEEAGPRGCPLHLLAATASAWSRVAEMESVVAWVEELRFPRRWVASLPSATVPAEIRRNDAPRCTRYTAPDDPSKVVLYGPCDVCGVPFMDHPRSGS